jgi:AraC-like DNA-binding protein
MDTAYIDQMSNIKLEYGFTMIPTPLKPYFSGLIDNLQLYEPDSEYNVLFHTNSYKLNFISAKVYDGTNYIGSILVGPYLLEQPTILMIESIISTNKMAISLKNIVKQYYLSLPIINTYKANTTAEFLSYLVSTSDSNCFYNSKIGSLTYDFQTEYIVSSEIIKQNTESAMEALEKRYSLEHAMLHAVETGNIGLFESIIKENTSFIENIPDRVPNDPLRSVKNSYITLNTLLRIGAERGGLHPIYLDSISSKYAVKIEKCKSLQQLSDLLNAMQMEYCDSVRKLSLKNYSSKIRKAIEYIRVNLNQNLSLDSISSALYLSPYELSRQFKKETGENITDYINKMRINEALFILENDDISITEVSYMVGFNDVNYFTKVFKKIKGITPSEYRRSKN